LPRLLLMMRWQRRVRRHRGRIAGGAGHGVHGARHRSGMIDSVIGSKCELSDSDQPYRVRPQR
jgi:hypothetical protein